MPKQVKQIGPKLLGLLDEQVALLFIRVYLFFFLDVTLGRESPKLPPSVCISPTYKRGRSFPSSFLSNDSFVSHRYFTYATTSLCHLLYCHFLEIDRLASDSELINDDIIAVISFR